MKGNTLFKTDDIIIYGWPFVVNEVFMNKNHQTYDKPYWSYVLEKLPFILLAVSLQKTIVIYIKHQMLLSLFERLSYLHFR